MSHSTQVLPRIRTMGPNRKTRHTSSLPALVPRKGLHSWGIQVSLGPRDHVPASCQKQEDPHLDKFG